jgi:chromosomal replication initiation ATPase DnaA
MSTATISLESINTEDLIAELKRRRDIIEESIGTGRQIELSRVILAVCQAWGVPSDSLFDQSRRTIVCEPRQAAMVILRNHHGWTYQAIGCAFGFDHGTVMHAVRTHPGRMTTGIFATMFNKAISALNVQAMASADTQTPKENGQS